jgi:hypothetical protein
MSKANKKLSMKQAASRESGLLGRGIMWKEKRKI